MSDWNTSIIEEFRTNDLDTSVCQASAAGLVRDLVRIDSIRLASKGQGATPATLKAASTPANFQEHEDCGER
jgi:hypothetical protein